MRLQVSHLSFAYDNDTILKDIHMEIHSGEFIGILGANGSGKSTLLKNLYGILTPDSGKATLDGKNLLTMGKKEIASRVGVVSQENHIPFSFTVEEIVAMGRTPHKKLFQGDNKKDKEIIQNALRRFGLLDMAKRDYRQLSGGEKQRVLLARVVAQESDFLFLDEPTNHLDIGYQIQFFDLVKQLGITVLAAIHDLNMAALYCDRIYTLKEGTVHSSGTPQEILTSETIYQLFNVRSFVDYNDVMKCLSISFLPGNIYHERGGSSETKEYHHVKHYLNPPEPDIHIM